MDKIEKKKWSKPVIISTLKIKETLSGLSDGFDNGPEGNTGS
jgi:hypothetical protein